MFIKREEKIKRIIAELCNDVVYYRNGKWGERPKSATPKYWKILHNRSNLSTVSGKLFLIINRLYAINGYVKLSEVVFEAAQINVSQSNAKLHLQAWSHYMQMQSSKK